MPRIRINFKNKIFVFFGLLITGSVLLILYALNNQLKNKMTDTLVHDLVRIRSVLLEYQEARLELLELKSRFLADEPRLKAAVETQDPSTVTREAQKFLPAIETDFLLITDENGRILAQLGNLHLDAPSVGDVPAIRGAQQMQKNTMLVQVQQQVFLIISRPITVMDPFGRTFLLGTISLGQLIDEKFLEKVKNLTGSEVGFISRTDSLASFQTLFSFSNAARADTTFFAHSMKSQQVQEIEIEQEKFLVLAVSLFPGKFSHRLLLFKSPDNALKPILWPMQNVLLFIGAISLFGTLLLSFLLARGITSPVTKLVQAARQMRQGDLSTPIPVAGNDEISYLAENFEELRLSLKKKISELEKTYSRLVQSEKLATTGKLLAQLSHEINNPLHNISSALEAAKNKFQNDRKAADLVEIAFEEVQRLAKLVRQTLDFYRQSPHGRTLVDFNDILEELFKISEKSFLKNGIQIVKNYAGDLPKISANRDQLKQVFLNLLLNARDAMPDGGKLEIKTLHHENRLQIEISDSGIGIPPENQSKIFDAFFTTKSQASGVGLGLSVSYEIVRQHNGEIEVESEPGQGTRFRISLPVS